MNLTISLRKRAGVQTPSFSKYNTYEKFRQFVRNERARELCFEGLRKHDLIRWGIYYESMMEVRNMAMSNSKWSGTGSARNFITLTGRMSKRNNYLPIPSIELAVNTGMKQNPLW